MSSTTARYFVDTNVAVYLFDSAYPSKQSVARRTFEDSSRELVVSTQVLAEFYVVTTRKLATPLPPLVAARAVRELAGLEVVSMDPALVLSAAELSRRSDLSLWDAMIVEAAARAGCATLLTEDLASDAEIRGVRILNPFEV